MVARTVASLKKMTIKVQSLLSDWIAGFFVPVWDKEGKNTAIVQIFFPKFFHAVVARPRVVVEHRPARHIYIGALISALCY